MQIINLLNQAIKNKKTLFSFELLPPLKGNSIQRVFDTIDLLREFDPQYINLTSHRDEIKIVTVMGGTAHKKIICKRPGTVAVAAAIKNKYKIPVVPHLICSGFSPEETENTLIDLNFLGIYNLLLLRGDTSYNHNAVSIEKENCYALDLIKQVNSINKGIYLDGTQAESFNTPFSYGIAGYPEKHKDALSMESDIYYLKKKVEAGADYIVTQMFFDNQKYFEFVKLVREAGINVPIIPGLKPITTLKQLSVLPQIFKVNIPSELEREIKKCKTSESIKQLGIEWGIKQGRELIQQGVPSLHFYVMMASESVKTIVGEIF